MNYGERFFRNGNGHLKRGRGKATACGRDVALGGNTFLSSMPEIILKRVYGRRPRAMRPPSQRSTGAAHDDRDRSLLVPHSPQSTLCRGRRGNTSTIFIFTNEQRTTLNFNRPCTLPRGGSDPPADAWGETPRRLHTFWHNFGVWPRKRVLYTAFTRRSRVQRRAPSRFQGIDHSTRSRTSSPRRG